MTNPSSVQSLSLATDQTSAQVNLAPFGAVSIRIPQLFSSLKYQMDPENKCLDLQIFFSKSKLPDDLSFGSEYSRLGLGGVANDFNNYFWPGTLAPVRDLKFQLAEFYKDHELPESATVYMNFFCPFWEKSDSEESLRVVFNYEKIESKILDRYEQSEEEFVRVTGTLPSFAVRSFEKYFNGKLATPATTEIKQISHVIGTVDKVRADEHGQSLTEDGIFEESRFADFDFESEGPTGSVLFELPVQSAGPRVHAGRCDHRTEDAGSGHALRGIQSEVHICGVAEWPRQNDLCGSEAARIVDGEERRRPVFLGHRGRFGL